MVIIVVILVTLIIIIEILVGHKIIILLSWKVMLSIYKREKMHINNNITKYMNKIKDY